MGTLMVTPRTARAAHVSLWALDCQCERGNDACVQVIALAAASLLPAAWAWREDLWGKGTPAGA